MLNKILLLPVSIVYMILLTLTPFHLNSVEKLEAPFVSNLQTTASGSKVLLTWSNPLDFTHNITVYRSTRSLNKPTRLLTAQKLTVLKSQEEKFIDTPGPGSYYYAVIITDSETRQDKLILVPFRNYSLSAVEITNVDLYSITTFDAQANESSITLQWDYTSETTELTTVNLFRNTVPITNQYALESSIKIANVSINSRLFVDVPIANIEYYYAIFIDGDPAKEFIPGKSITTDPVSIKRKKETISDFSIDNFIPLPLITLTNDPKSGKMFLDPQILKSPRKIKYNQKVSNIINQVRQENMDVYNNFMQEINKKSIQPDIHILFDEEVYDAGDYGPEYSNSVSLIEKRSLKEALSILEQLLTENLNEQFQERVSYYIGQIYFASGDFQTAYIHLIMAYDRYRPEVLPYLEVIQNQVFIQMER